MAKDNKLTISIETAGRDYFGLGRASAYAAARAGHIPTIRIGRLYRVPVRALEAMLDGAQPRVKSLGYRNEEWPGYG